MSQVASAETLPGARRSALIGLGSGIALFALLWVVAGSMLLWLAAALPAALGGALAAVALFVLPGLALLRLLWPSPLAPAERWSLAIGLSCAIVPVLVLAASLVGFRWNAFTVWALLGVALLLTVWPGRTPVSWRTLRTYRPGLTLGLLLLLTALALTLRLYVVRDLPAAMFGDSYHHTMITQLLIDNSGLFQSWEPYAPLKTLTYHYGFQSVAAFFSLLTSQPATIAVVVIGQVESALAVPLLYLFTLRLLRDERAALFAALLVAFVSIMPAYYVNWGRYTQLGGQTVLLAALVAWMSLLDQAAAGAPRNQLLRLLALVALATAGLVLTHYRVAVFAACFVVVYGLYLVGSWRVPVPELASPRSTPLRRNEQVRSLRVAVFPSRRTPTLESPRTQVRLWPSPRIRRVTLVAVAAGAVTGVLVLPWLLRLREGALLKIGGYYLSNSVAVDAPLTSALGLYVQPFIAALAALGLMLLLWQREWRALLLPAWAALLWLAATPSLIGLPGTGILSGVAVLTGSYLVIVPLAAAGLSLAISRTCQVVRRSAWQGVVHVAVGALLIGWGLGWQQQLLTPQTQLLTNADVAAFAWVKRETPHDAKFFVNSFSAFGGGVYVGSDGGWWLPLLTGRTSNVPPATYGTEASERPDYQLWVKNDNAAILAQPLTSLAAAAALKAAGYSYLYDGPTNTTPGGAEFIRPAELAQSLLYKQVYQRDGVTIWKVR